MSITLWNPLKCNSIITKTMGNSMSSTHTEATLFLPHPTMPFVRIWDSQRFWLLRYTVEPLLSGPLLSRHLSYPDDKPDAKNQN